MTRWQRRARLFIGVATVAFALFVAFAFRRRAPGSADVPVVRTDPGAVVESTGGRVERFRLSHENVSVTYERQLTYADGSTKLRGVTIIADETGGEGSFRATAREAAIGKDETTIVLDGDVRLVSSEIRAHTEHATFSKSDNTVRAPGRVELTEGPTSANGVGMTFDRDRDALSILDQAVVHMTGDRQGDPATDITCGSATFARRDRQRRFEKNVRIQRGAQLIEAETAVASLSEDAKRIETVELRDGARITIAKPAAGALEALTGRVVTLKYAPDGQALQRALVGGGASIEVAGDAGKQGRQIAAAVMDIALGPDGSTPTALVARDAVVFTMPPEAGTSGRTIRSGNLEAKGEAGRGLTRALFSGDVQYRERGGTVDRAASAATLDVGLKPGLSAIEDARFGHAVRFEEGKLTAQAAAARYDLEKGTLELSGSEAGAVTPRVVNDQIAVDAAKIDVTLAGPKVTATGTVKSVLQPAKKPQRPGESGNDVRLPSMLKQDQAVNVTANDLDYDGSRSLATYKGDARLFQGDTSVKGETIVIDDRNGDLTASGDVTTTTMLEHAAKDRKKERVRSVATARDLKYDDADRRLTYTGDAHMTGPEGDMTAARIELYLKPSGDELDRAEAYDTLVLREQNRKTSGARMTYTADDERYVVTGTPVTIVDECGRETIGRTLTFAKATDSIVVDGNQQIRTQTKGGGKCTS